MVRGIGRIGPGRPVFSELQQNGDPPKSTLAAQLVNHFTDGKKHPKNQDQETFRQLLREVLGAESEQQCQTDKYETDTDVNYKLIYVIVKAGLETPTRDDPFSEQDERLRQVIDSLVAVECTIRRDPDALFVVPSSQGPGPNCHGPLFIWLIPKVLALAGQSSDGGIRAGILKLLKTILSLERKTHIGGVNLHSILKYSKGCIKGQSVVLRSGLGAANQTSKTFCHTLKLPP